MKQELLRKLEELLEGPLTRECEVAYIMLEIRKMLDHVGQAYGTLRFYCDWAMHVVMDREGARILVSIVDEELAKPKGEQWEWDPEMKAHSVFLFSRLSDDLRRFLSDFSLPAQVVNEPFEWVNFLNLYTRIVSDCPLTHKNVQTSFKYLAALVVRIGMPPAAFMEANPGTDVLCLDWELLHKDGRTSKMSALLGRGRKLPLPV